MSGCQNTPDRITQIAQDFQTIGIIPENIDVSRWNVTIIEPKTELDKKRFDVLPKAMQIFTHYCLSYEPDPKKGTWKLSVMAKNKQHFSTCSSQDFI